MKAEDKMFIFKADFDFLLYFLKFQKEEKTSLPGRTRKDFFVAISYKDACKMTTIALRSRTKEEIVHLPRISQWSTLNYTRAQTTKNREKILLLRYLILEPRAPQDSMRSIIYFLC